MQLDYFKEFLVFSEYMNISKAAKYLQTSQPVLSRHISEIEKELGVKLFDRKNLTLTSAGKMFLKGACEFLSVYESAVAETVEAFKQDHYELVVRAPVIFDNTARLLFDLIRRFKERYPFISVRLIEEKRSSLEDLLDAGKIDVSISYYPAFFVTDDKHFKLGDKYGLIEIYESKVCLWAHRDHPLAKKGNVITQDLDGLCFPVQAIDSMQDLRLALHEYCKGMNIHVSYRMEPIDFIDEFYLLSIKRGDAVLISEDMKENSTVCSRDDMVFLTLDNGTCMQKTYLISRHDNNNEALSMFLEFVEEQLPVQRDSVPITT